MKFATSILALVSLLACLPVQAAAIHVGGGGPNVDWICATIDAYTDFDMESCPVPDDGRVINR